MKKQVALAAFAALALLLLLGVGAFAAISSWMDGLCGNTEISRAPSPDGRYDAIIFERNCGATTGFATHVSLIPRGDPLPNAAGNLLSADLDDGGSPAPWGGPRVTASWRAAGDLVVQHDPLARVIHQASRDNAVTVSYEPLPAPE
jgi:hypothetical protein